MSRTELHPRFFKVNDAWIAFRLNDAPIETKLDGTFNCMALMDAASCYILGMEFYSAESSEPSGEEARRLLQQGRKHKQQLPRQLLVPSSQPATALTKEAARTNIAVVPVEESDLLVFIGEARDEFRKQFGRTQ